MGPMLSSSLMFQRSSSAEVELRSRARSGGHAKSKSLSLSCTDTLAEQTDLWAKHEPQYCGICWFLMLLR